MADTKQKTIYVKQGFVLTKDDGEKVAFPAGRHPNVPQEIADHWFVKLHLGDEADLASEADQDLVQVAEAEIEQLKKELAAEKAARAKAEEDAKAAADRADKAERQVTALQAEIEQLKKKGK